MKFHDCHSPYNRGVHFEFENGYAVSVQWGPVNYCSNYGKHPIRCDSSVSAEIAVFDINGNFVKPERYGFPDMTDDVVGHVTPDKVVDVMAFVKSW